MKIKSFNDVFLRIRRCQISCLAIFMWRERFRHQFCAIFIFAFARVYHHGFGLFAEHSKRFVSDDSFFRFLSPQHVFRDLRKLIPRGDMTARSCRHSSGLCARSYWPWQPYASSIQKIGCGIAIIKSRNSKMRVKTWTAIGDRDRFTLIR